MEQLNDSRIQYRTYANGELNGVTTVVDVGWVNHEHVVSRTHYVHGELCGSFMINEHYRTIKGRYSCGMLDGEHVTTYSQNDDDDQFWSSWKVIMYFKNGVDQKRRVFYRRDGRVDHWDGEQTVVSYAEDGTVDTYAAVLRRDIGLFTRIGRYERRSADGWLLASGQYDPRGARGYPERKIGQWRKWYPNGQIMMCGSYAKGVCSGLWIQWTMDGIISMYGINDSNGEPIGNWFYRDDVGDVIHIEYKQGGESMKIACSEIPLLGQVNEALIKQFHDNNYDETVAITTTTRWQRSLIAYASVRKRNMTEMTETGFYLFGEQIVRFRTPRPVEEDPYSDADG
jgi:antitoxin component YwqK of YwqJK toxin-antitoxin module